MKEIRRPSTTGWQQVALPTVPRAWGRGDCLSRASKEVREKSIRRGEGTSKGRGLEA